MRVSRCRLFYSSCLFINYLFLSVIEPWSGLKNDLSQVLAWSSPDASGFKQVPEKSVSDESLVARTTSSGLLMCCSRSGYCRFLPG